MKFLQIPDGLKTKALEIADELGDVVISCETCYGACDILEDEAKLLGCNKIVHYGHSKMIDADIEVEYVEKREKYNPTKVLEEIKINYKRIGLVSAIQFLDSLDIAKKVLEKQGKEVLIGGQVLGCDIFRAEKIKDSVDCFLFIGSGHFHALGVALKTGKPTFVLNIEKGNLEELDTKLFVKQKYAAQALFKDANVIGILVSTKLGQMNIKLAKQIKEKLKPRKSYILSMDEIRPEKLLGIKVDAYVNTACPRIAVENRTDFGKPILNPDEI